MREAGESGADETADTGDGRTVPLDDVMIAMDVVDTLRHDDRIVARELNREGKRAELIERLREIYRGQGIEVPDRILEEGVQALEEDRFVYKPPPNTFKTRLAKIYVTRDRWGRAVAGILVALVAVWLVYYLGVQRPGQRAAEERTIALNQTLPREFDELNAAIVSEATEESVAARAESLVTTGRNAIRAENLAAARSARDGLARMLAVLRSEFEIRIVSRSGEMTGLWRVPRANPNANNYYLVVEAIGPDGAVIPQTLLNEETGHSETVPTWAVRVSPEVFQSVQADKQDDGIIQNAAVGRKARGRLTREWSIPTLGGFLTRW